MRKEDKIALHALISELVIANREQVWEESRWDCSKRERTYAQEAVSEAEEDLNSFIARLK